MNDPLKQSPEIVKAAIAQAESEVRAAADRHDELVRVVEPQTVAGRPATKLSYARRLIMSKVAGKLWPPAPDGSPGETPSEHAVVLTVFVLFGAPLMQIEALSNSPQAFLDRSWAFADELPEDQYAQLARYAEQKLEHLGQASSMGSDGIPEEAGPGKNARS
jgi:hypothetical protein